MDERECWIRYVGPDPDSDELYGLVCPECNEEILEGDEVWYQKVAFCRHCLPRFKRRVEGTPNEPSEALKRLRRKLHDLR